MLVKKFSDIKLWSLYADPDGEMYGVYVSFRGSYDGSIIWTFYYEGVEIEVPMCDIETNGMLELQ
jgi:hypothetical protein